MKSVMNAALCLTLGIIFWSVDATPTVAADNPFVGSWALTIPGGGAGWLGVEDKDGKLEGSILWGGGSVVPVSSVRVDGDTLVVTRVHQRRRRRAAEPTQETETIKATLDGDAMKLTTQCAGADGKVRGSATVHRKTHPRSASRSQSGQGEVR